MASRALLLLLLLLCSAAKCQRLSQGASDWYMRFHEFEMVKRNVETPSIRLFHVNTAIRHRYTVTEVRTVVHNPAKFRQDFKFGFAMPNAAFVSNVTLLGDDEERITAKVKLNDWIMNLMSATHTKNGNGNGNGNGNHGNGNSSSIPYSWLNKDKLESFWQQENSDFKQFVLPMHLGPNRTIELTLVFEYLLTRKRGKYSHSVSISPGQLVRDFKIGLTIEEDFPITFVNVTAPVIGDITADVLDAGGLNVKSVEFNMSLLEQSHYFGSHGFTGDFNAEFDLDLSNSVDLAVQDDYFLHFYDIPRPMKSIPKHVIFGLDTSVSMSGPKMGHAVEAIKQLLSQLGEDSYVNMLLFNESVKVWRRPDNNSTNNVTEEVEETVYSATEEIKETLMLSLSNMSTSVGPSNLSKVVEKALSLDRFVWKSGKMPENAYTLLIILTDGHSHRQHADMLAVRRNVRQSNKILRVPLFFLGMGFDANMNLLEKLSNKWGGLAVNVIEDLEVAPQLALIRRNLDDVVIKNLQLNYIGEEVFKSVTETKFKTFRKGGVIAVSGKLQPKQEMKHRDFEVEVTGQSADGLYMETPATVPLDPLDCEGDVILCSELSLQGQCISLDMSRSSLKQFSFGNQGASLNVSGDCMWVAYSEAYYQGRSIILMPGLYEAIPDMHKDISSLRKLPTAAAALANKKEEEVLKKYNLLERIWAYLTIKDKLRRLDLRPENVNKARVAEVAQVAVDHNFLTPFSDLYLINDEHNETEEEEEHSVEPSADSLVDSNVISFGDLDPVFFSEDPDILRQWESLKSCKPPVQCSGNFHFEEMPDVVTEEDSYDEEVSYYTAANCTGTITFFTRPNFEGEELEVGQSVHQLYHSVNSQRMMSVETRGDCCWLLFDRRFFSGDVEKVCGDFEQRLRMTNIGSVKRIGPPTKLLYT